MSPHEDYESDPPPPRERTWAEYRREVLSDLDELKVQAKETTRAIAKLERDFAVLAVRVSLYASGAALVASAAIEFVVRLAHH